MAKTYFEDITEGRSANGEKINPFAVVICGLDSESAKVAAQGAEEAAEVAALTMPTNHEIGEFLRSPDKFLKTWPDEGQRVYMHNMLEGLIQHGSNLKPITAKRVGGHFVVVDGRHNTACLRVAREALTGKRHVKAIEGLVRMMREERGSEWLPVLTALPPVKDAMTGEAMDAGYVADLSQQVRVLTLVEVYERAMRKVRASRAADTKPDFAAIGRGCGQTASTVEGWERLSKLPKAVREYVLIGHEGRRFPLSSALALSGLPEDLMVAKVQAMLAEGDTRVATAKATARGVAEADRDKADRATASGDRNAARGENTTDATPREATGEVPSAQSGPADATPREVTGEALDEAGPSDTRRAPWKVRETRRFLESDALNAEDHAVFSAVSKLFVDSPDALTPSDFRALGALGRALKAYLKKTK